MAKAIFVKFEMPKELQDKAYEISHAAARIAREAADAASTKERPRFVAGSMGPGTKTISVTGGVTFDEVRAAFAEPDVIPFANRKVERRKTALVLARPHDPRLGEARLQLGRRADVVMMMVGEPDVGQGPAFFGERLPNRLGLRRIQRGGRSRPRVMGEEAEIVVEAKELVKLLWWMTHQGQKYAEPLEYAPLSRKAVEKAERLIKSISFKSSIILK